MTHSVTDGGKMEPIGVLAENVAWATQNLMSALLDYRDDRCTDRYVDGCRNDLKEALIALATKEQG